MKLKHVALLLWLSIQSMTSRAEHHLSDVELQIAEAQYLRSNYLKRATFIGELPSAINGKAMGLSKQFSSHFSTSGTSEASGYIHIDSLQGLMRVPTISTDNLLYQNRQVKLNGTASVAQGQLNIYSPVVVDFWQMAAVFVDRPVRQKPESAADFQLKGFLVKPVQAGESVKFTVNLLPFSNRYLLLLGSDEGEAKGIRLTFD